MRCRKALVRLTVVGCGTREGSAPLNLEAGGTRYFMIKSFSSDNVEIAVHEGTWATQQKNLDKFTEAFNQCRKVVLIFSVNNSKAFQGYVSILSFISYLFPFSLCAIGILPISCIYALGLHPFLPTHSPGFDGISPWHGPSAGFRQGSPLEIYRGIPYPLDHHLRDALQPLWASKE